MSERARRDREWYPWSHRDRGYPTVQALHDDRTRGERVADAIARFGGSWPFIFAFLGLILLFAGVLVVLLS